MASESKIKKWKRKNNPERVCLELLWSVICLSTAYIFLHYYWNSFSFVSKPLQRYSSSFGLIEVSELVVAILFLSFQGETAVDQDNESKTSPDAASNGIPLRSKTGSG